MRGVRVAAKRVWRLMKAAGLRGRVGVGVDVGLLVE
ncbi:MAG: hypothetical protein ACRDQ6_05770 [Pseudonocardiaceae bacterium]